MSTVRELAEYYGDGGIYVLAMDVDHRLSMIGTGEAGTFPVSRYNRSVDPKVGEFWECTLSRNPYTGVREAVPLRLWDGGEAPGETSSAELEKASKASEDAAAKAVVTVEVTAPAEGQSAAAGSEVHEETPLIDELRRQLEEHEEQIRDLSALCANLQSRIRLLEEAGDGEEEMGDERYLTMILNGNELHCGAIPNGRYNVRFSGGMTQVRIRPEKAGDVVFVDGYATLPGLVFAEGFERNTMLSFHEEGDEYVIEA